PNDRKFMRASGRLASRRRRPESSNRALTRVSWHFRGAAYKATEARRRRIFADHLGGFDFTGERAAASVRQPRARGPSPDLRRNHSGILNFLCGMFGWQKWSGIAAS